MFNVFKRRAKTEDVAVAAAAAAEPEAEAPALKLEVSHHLDHSLNDVKQIAWDGVRRVLGVVTGSTLWIIGNGWAQRRHKIFDDLDEDKTIISISFMTSSPIAVVVTSKSVIMFDYQIGAGYVRPAEPKTAYTSSNTLVGHDWILAGRSDGLIQGINNTASLTSLFFSLSDVPGAIEDSKASSAITWITSRMFHRQIAIIQSQQTGLIQVNFVRKELLARFDPPPMVNITYMTMCAIDKYLLAGLEDGRILVWKANDESRCKRKTLPPMAEVTAARAQPVLRIECYGAGVEDVIPCRWITTDLVVEGSIKPKKNVTTTTGIVHVSTSPFNGGMCGIVNTPWRERTELPSQVIVVVNNALQVLIAGSGDVAGQWHVTQLTKLPSTPGWTGKIGNCIAMKSYIPSLLSHTPRHGIFPWNAAGKSPFAPRNAPECSLLIASDTNGSLAVMKTLLANDAICPQVLRAFDSVSSPASTNIPGFVKNILNDNVLLCSTGGNLYWIDMVTLQASPVPDLVVRVAEFNAALNILLIGTDGGEVYLYNTSSAGNVISIRVSDSPISTISMCQVEGVEGWIIKASHTDGDGETELTIIQYNPTVPSTSLDEVVQEDVEKELLPPLNSGNGEFVAVHRDTSPSSVPEEVVVPLPRTLRILNRFIISVSKDESTSSQPELHLLTHPLVSQKSSGIPKSFERSAADRKIPFGTSPVTKAIQLPPVVSDMTVVIRLSDSSLDSQSKMVQVRLLDAAGFEVVTASVKRIEKPAHCSITLTWWGSKVATRNIIRKIDIDEVPLVVGEDSLLAVRISEECCAVVTFGSVDAGRVPSNEQFCSAMQKCFENNVMANGGPMWAVKHVTPFTASECSESCRHSVVAARCVPEGSVSGFQIFDDVANPDADDECCLSVIPSEEEICNFIPTFDLQSGYSFESLLMKGGDGTLRQLQVESTSISSPTVPEGMTRVNRGPLSIKGGTPLKVNGNFIKAESIVVVRLEEFGQIVFIRDGCVLYGLKLPLIDQCEPLITYKSASLESLKLSATVAASNDQIHITGAGNSDALLHLVILINSSPDEVSLCMADADVAKGGPFSTVDELQPRPPVKAPGMGMMTMKGMFKNHQQEVSCIDDLIAKVRLVMFLYLLYFLYFRYKKTHIQINNQVTEESFDDFATRVIPEKELSQYVIIIVIVVVVVGSRLLNYQQTEFAKNAETSFLGVVVNTAHLILSHEKAANLHNK